MSESEKSVCEKRVFDRLFDLHAETLRNYLYYQSGNLPQAEDLVQEAFIKLWNNCKKVVFEKARGFLFAVAKNAFYNQVEHQKVVLKYAKRPQRSVEHETPEYQLEEKEYRETLESAIAALPEGQREVFLMNRIDGMTYKEIAAFLEVSQKAVEKRMHKALVKLRKTVRNI
ncbi:sigma-70 family RNA polymerase sigma factor [Flagellimonas sp. DF-77]|uniref:RNA polymerase sigma factor n=1 Tax=Flagellimonas algarum TaxID=3230298 RepID=UPI003399620B